MVRVHNSRIVLFVYAFVVCGTWIQELQYVLQALSPSQYGDCYFRLHSRHCVVKSRNKLLWPSVCRREGNDHLTCLFQISDETNVLQDGTLIDLCGATLLWRSHEGLEKSPVSWIYVWYTVRGIQVLSYEPVHIRMLLKRGCLYLSIQKCECWYVQHTTSTRVKLVGVIKNCRLYTCFLNFRIMLVVWPLIGCVISALVIIYEMVTFIVCRNIRGSTVCCNLVPDALMRVCRQSILPNSLRNV